MSAPPSDDLAVLPAVSPERSLDARSDDDESFSAVVAAVTAAFGDTTRRQIYLHARDSSGLTATEIAKRFALHPNVARHHLDKLAAGGYLEVSIDHAGIGAGRPSKRYRRSGRPMAIPAPSRPDELVVALLVRTLALLDPAVAEQMAVEVGAEYGRSLAAQMAPGDSQRSIRSAMQTVVDALTAHGFAAHAEAQGSSTSIIRDHCPFGELARQHPVLCAVDRGMVEGLLGGLCGKGAGTPVRMSSRALGDAACATMTSTAS